jgi:hypothetical protein
VGGPVGREGEGEGDGVTMTEVGYMHHETH